MIEAFLDALKIHGPIGAVLLVMGYVGKVHISRDREHQKLLDLRVAALEQDRVTKHDLERVFDRIEAVSDQVSENQRVLLSVLTRKDGQSPD